MAYRLRRMVLVNTGTNKFVPSQRFSEIDPRGGAAVVGENGVGKTTSLRLVPLFFGHLPSQIVSSGDGHQAMVRFILSTYESAIAFEYQRGPSEERDVRLVVMRARKDNPEAAEYRLFESGFRRDLFVGADGVFLDDEGSVDSARSMRINCTPKLSTADYRSVILNLRASNKDALKLRGYARDYSLGPKAMPNLDRLVAAVVKKHVSFADLIQVAVGMVQEDIGTSGAADRNKLLLKQTKNEISDWVRNRRACESSLKLAPKVAEIRSSIDQFHREEGELRLLAAELQGLLADKTSKLAAAVAFQAELEAARAGAEETESATRKLLQDVANEAADSLRKVKKEHDDCSYLKNHLEQNQARQWARRQEDIPNLNAELDQIAAEQALYEGTRTKVRQDIEGEVLRLKAALREAEQSEIEAVNARSKDAEDRYSLEKEELDVRRQSSLDAAAEQNELRRDTLDEAIHAFRRGVANIAGQLMHADGPPELRREVQEQRAKLNELVQILSDARAEESTCERDKLSAKTAFDNVERDLATEIDRLAAAKQLVADIERELTPVPDSLLAALRHRPGEEWDSLSKIISPELLHRDDLKPVFDAANDDLTAYGWSLDLAVVPFPDWLDEEEVRGRLSSAKREMELVHLHCEELRAELEQAAARFDGASEKLNDAGIAVSLADRNREMASIALDRATAELAFARKTERERLETDQRQLEEELATKEAEVAECKEAADNEKRAIIGRFEKESGDLVSSRKVQRDKYETERKTIAANRVRAEQALDARANERLSEAGLDPQKNEVWNKRKRDIGNELRQIQARASLISQWQEWIETHGDAKLEQLKAQQQQAEKAYSTADRAAQDHEAACRRTAEEYRTRTSEASKRITNLQGECDKLNSVTDNMEGYAATRTVAFDPMMSAVEMAGKVAAAISRRNATERNIGQLYLHVYNALTGSENVVKQYIEEGLRESTSESKIDKARILANRYDGIPSEIVGNLNNTLRAILDTVERFHGSILGFETLVRQFNNRLKQGLTAVTQFPRVKDLRLEIVTDFSNLGFMDRLKKVSQFVAENHFTLGRTSHRTQIPDGSADLVLEDFANAIGGGGRIEINLASHVQLQGSVSENGIPKTFRRESELENVSSNGLTSIILITLLIGMLNMIRGQEDVYIAWVTDEIGKFDGPNFTALMDMLRDNRIDVITASPELNVRHYRKFAQRYRFEDRGVIRMFVPPPAHSNVAEGVARFESEAS